MVKALFNELGQRVQAAKSGRMLTNEVRGLEFSVHQAQSRFIATQGGGTWGRPLYRTGLLHSLLKRPTVGVTRLSGGTGWQIEFAIRDSKLGGRVNLVPYYEFFDRPALAFLVRSRIGAAINKRKTTTWTVFSRLGRV